MKKRKKLNVVRGSSKFLHGNQNLGLLTTATSQLPQYHTVSYVNTYYVNDESNWTANNDILNFCNIFYKNFALVLLMTTSYCCKQEK